MKLLSCFAIFPLLVSCDVQDKVPAFEPEKVVTEPARAIDVLASECAKYSFKDRGRVPQAFLKGLVEVYRRHKADPIDALGPVARDALTSYNLVPTNENLYALLLGLAMRESSGRYCCGLDQHSAEARKGTAGGSTTEAGAFQFSYNSISADYGTAEQSRLRKLYAFYSTNKAGCLLDTFKQGISCPAADLKNWGVGEGAKFQALAKECPAFAVEYAAVAVRVVKAHFGPLVRHEAEVVPACVSLFKGL